MRDLQAEVASRLRGGGGSRGEGRVVGDAEVGEVGVQLAGLEADEADDVPEGAADVAAHLVAAVGGEGGPAFGAGEEDGEAAGGGQVPEAEGAVGGGGGEGEAVGAKGDAQHPILMSLEGSEGAAGGDVPEAHGLVIGPGGEGSAIGAEGDAPHPFSCPSKARSWLPVATSQRRTVLS